MTDQTSPRTIPLSLFAFAVFYGGMICTAGILANKQAHLFDVPGYGPLAVESGIFPFLMLVIIASAVTEIWGAKTAQKLVYFGFVPLIIASALTFFVLSLPPAEDMQADRLDAFNLLLASTPRIWLAGIAAYGTSTLLNVWIFDRMKKPGGRLLWLRSAVAGVLSQTVDSLIFITIAFLGVFPILPLLIGQMLAKAVLSFIAIPPLVALAVKLAHKIDASKVATEAG